MKITAVDGLVRLIAKRVRVEHNFTHEIHEGTLRLANSASGVERNWRVETSTSDHEFNTRDWSVTAIDELVD